VREKSATSTSVTSSEKVTVKFTLASLVGLGLARALETTVGAVVSTTTRRGKANTAETFPAASLAHG